MKRLLCIFLTLLLILSAVGCNPAPNATPKETDPQEQTESTADSEEDTSGNSQQTSARTPSIADIRVVPSPVSEWEPLQTELLKTDFFDAPLNADRLTLDDGKEHLPLLRLDTVEQLDAFNAILKELSPMGSTQFASATEKMNRDFLEYYDLFVAHATTESISHKFRVDLNNTADNVLTVNLVREPSSGVLDQIGTWLVIVPIDTRVHLDGATEFDAILTKPTFADVQARQILRVQFFDSDSFSFHPKADDFYSDALNSEQLQKIYSMRNHMPIFRFDTLAELTAFNEAYRDLLDVGGGAATVTEATADIDAKFFETHSLLAVYVISGSGSFKYHLENVEMTGDSILVHIAQDPFPTDCDYTCDMDAWIALIPIEKTLLANVTHFDAIRTYDH